MITKELRSRIQSRASSAPSCQNGNRDALQRCQDENKNGMQKPHHPAPSRHKAGRQHGAGSICVSHAGAFRDTGKGVGKRMTSQSLSSASTFQTQGRDDCQDKIETFERFCLLHVKDGAFNFTSQNDMKKASKMIGDMMTRFRLIKHIGGNNGGMSKTKAMCCPPMPEEASNVKDEAPGREEATFAVDEGHISTFTHKFKCSGSLIAQDLKDNDNNVR
jgi:hypothetical protein